MRISENGLKFLKEMEGFHKTAYKNSEREKYYSIGYGHYSKSIKKDTKISELDADKFLRSDVHKYEGRVAKYNKIYNFNQNQFDALVCFCFNVGDIDRLTDFGKKDIKEIKERMILYCSINKRISKELIQRRKKEIEFFLK